LFGEGTGPNIDKNTNTTKPHDGPTYGMVFETADPHFDKQINTHFTAVAAYLEKQVRSRSAHFDQTISFDLGWIINPSAINDSL